MKLVFLLEDNPNDTELILRALRGLVLVCPVSYRNDYIVGLAENEFDLIVCDLNVFTFLDFETVTIARAAKPNTPLIVLTGSMSEIETKRSLEYGASCYIMKNGFKELRIKVKEILGL